MPVAESFLALMLESTLLIQKKELRKMWLKEKVLH
jgi:hypothetical protein